MSPDHGPAAASGVFVHVHAAPLVGSDVVTLNGVAVTSAARTVLDLARTVSFHQAVSAGDRALALGLDPSELRESLSRMRSWPGVRAAHRTCALLDPRSESVGESFSRVRFVEQGIPAPMLQYEVYDENGCRLPGATSAGSSNGHSASSTARSSTTASSARVRPPAMWCTRRRFVKMLSAIAAGRWSDGRGPTSSVPR